MPVNSTVHQEEWVVENYFLGDAYYLYILEPKRIVKLFEVHVFQWGGHDTHRFGTYLSLELALARYDEVRKEIKKRGHPWRIS